MGKRPFHAHRRRHAPGCEALVEKLGIRAGQRVLDLGCGDGTTALRAAAHGAEVLGIDIARNLVEAGSRRAQAARLANIRFQEGDAYDLRGIADDSFDMVVSIFGAMFAPKPDAVAREMVRVTKRGGRIVMGNWIPNDPTLIAQVLKISSAYAPARPEGFISPMTWGVESYVIERFMQAGIAQDAIHCDRDTFVLGFSGTPTEFVAACKDYYGPTMNAFEAAGKSGRAAQLQRELEALFMRENASVIPGQTRIPATFLHVIVQR